MNSQSVDQDYVVDVTQLLKDMRLYSTYYGLMLHSVNEEYYSHLWFCSSDHSTSSKHPKLEITYTINQGSRQIESFEYVDQKWKNVDNDDIDWLIREGSTPTSGTGPSSAISGDMYAYIEASSPNYPYKTAILQSDPIYLNGINTAEISFNYHMYGSTVNFLCIEVSTNGGTNWSHLWNRSGNQLNEWHAQTIDLSDYIGDIILLRFRGVTGSDYSSDIALDSIVVEAGESLKVETATHKSYISTTTPLAKNGVYGQLLVDIQYYDGLGRANQRVSVGNSPLVRDLVTPIVYDEYGKVKNEYLPYPADDNMHGDYRTFVWDSVFFDSPQEDFYQSHFSLAQNNPFAYSRNKYDESPLQRVIKKGSPGIDWQLIEDTGGSTEQVKEYAYGANSASEVRYYSVNHSTGELLNSPQYYQASELFKNTSWDEDDNKIAEYRNKEGKLILKSRFKIEEFPTYTQITTFSTYYVYDDFGLLRYVIPPKVTGSPSSNDLESLCYYYEYDHKQRMIKKKLPGVDTVYMVYDDRNRLVLTQDGELGSTGDWIFTAYDNRNRPAVSGKINKESVIIGAELNSSDFNVSWNLTTHDYNLPSYLASATVLSKTFYDTYDFLDQSGINLASFNGTVNIDDYIETDNNQNGYYDHTSGQQTGSAIKVLTGISTDWIYSAHYYDDKYRVIQTQQNLFPNGTLMQSTKYDFTGKILKTKEIQHVNSVSNIVLKEHEYDHAERLINTYITVNNEDPILLSNLKYNEIGELIEKNIHAEDASFSDFEQEIDYSYNIRGWLTKINDPGTFSDGDFFGMELFYEKESSSFYNNGVYNGNISAIHMYRNNGDNNAYVFNYDDLNRITDATYWENNYGNWITQGKYLVSCSYDANGNITSLNRNGSTGIPIDGLNYAYTGNQLMDVSDYFTEGYNAYNTSGNDFIYDENGNLTIDKNRRIEISYNHLNLPSKIESTTSTDEITYIYDAEGTKWVKKYIKNGIKNNTMYAGSFIYEDNDGDAVNDYILDYILHSEGMVEMTGSTLVHYQYNLKDHLGNTRSTFNAGSITQLQKPDYYPFGMQFNNTLGGDNKYLYNGKELQDDMLGTVNLDWYDYGARFYDPAIGRWHVPDPLAEQYQTLSPYNYVANNPINLIDPDGMRIDEYGIDDKGKVKFLSEKTGPDELYKIDGDGNKVDVDGDGQFTENNDFITVGDEDILSDLENSNQATSISSENSDDAFNVFKFASDNSKSEWGLVGYSENGSNQFALYTDLDGGNLTMPQYSLGVDNIKTFIHSHPGIGTDSYSENISMGKYVRPDNGQVQRYQSSDWGYKSRGLMPYQTAVYFPRTENVYQIKQNSIVLGGKFSKYK